MRLWLDAVSDIFVDDGGFMGEKDIRGAIACRPPRKARLAVNDVADRICPERLVWWYPEKKDYNHLNKMLVPEHTPLERGTKYAETAGVHAGSHQHTHFVFRVFEEGDAYFLDPWVIFWQTFKDAREIDAKGS